MSNLKEKYSRNWDFSVYEKDNYLIITVMFFDKIDYPRTFKLTKDESNFSFEEFVTLAENIRTNYINYKNREIVPPVMK